MRGVFLEVGQRRSVLEAHEEGEVESVVHRGALARDGASVADRFDEAGGLAELFGRADERGAVCYVAGTFEPDKDQVVDAAETGGGRRFPGESLDWNIERGISFPPLQIEMPPFRRETDEAVALHSILQELTVAPLAGGATRIITVGTV